MLIESHSGGATRPRKKFVDIFIRFDTLPACDGHVATVASREQQETQLSPTNHATHFCKYNDVADLLKTRSRSLKVVPLGMVSY